MNVTLVSPLVGRQKRMAGAVGSSTATTIDADSEAANLAAPTMAALAPPVSLPLSLIPALTKDDMLGDTESEDDDEDNDSSEHERDGTPILAKTGRTLLLDSDNMVGDAPASTSAASSFAAKLLVSADSDNAPPPPATGGGAEKRKALMTQLLCVQEGNVLPEDVKEKRHKVMDANFDVVTFAGLLRAGNPTHVLFHKEIRQRARNAGMASMSNEILEKYIHKIFGIYAFKPTKIVSGKRKQARGFKCIRFARQVTKINDVSEASEAVTSRVHPHAAVAKGICHTRPPLMLAVVKPRAVPSPSAPESSSAASESSATAGIPAGPKNAKLKPHAGLVRTWQQSIMSKLQASLDVVVSDGCVSGVKMQSVPAPPHASSASADIVGVGVVISLNRKGHPIVGGVVPGTSAALPDLVKVGAKILLIDNASTRGKSTDTLRTMMQGPVGTTVDLKLVLSNQIEHVVTLRRSSAVALSDNVVAAPPRKVFVYGGLQDDRDKCIGQLLGEHNAYLIDEPSQSTLLAIAHAYSKSVLPKSIVVVKYEEKHAAIADGASPAHTAGNKKLQNGAYEVARCLLNGYVWDEQHGQKVFAAPKIMIVVCNVQPYNRMEWEGWTFYNNGDVQA